MAINKSVAYAEEIELIDLNEKIEDKLMILVLYKDLCEQIKINLNDDQYDLYLPFLKASFNFTITGIRLNRNNEKFSAIEFMNFYLNLLLNTDGIANTNIYNVVKSFQKGLLQSIMMNDYVGIIDKYDSISLETKFNLAKDFKNYVSDVFAGINNYYHEYYRSSAMPEVYISTRNKLKEYLSNSISNNKSESLILKDFLSTLKESVKNFIKEQIFGNIKNNIMTKPDDEWRGYLNFQELALVDMGIVYYISQYKDTKNINIFENSFSVLLNRELVTDMCNILNMEMRDFSRFARATSEKISALLTESTNHTL